MADQANTPEPQSDTQGRTLLLLIVGLVIVGILVFLVFRPGGQGQGKTQAPGTAPVASH